ncbi:Crp/Fnr family transcriptional regulator [Labrys wisconsinensis]|uniref:Cyclic nucleotide-binding domain-containing protein n=1 Tax=Labrys wisconsinensis TaxID=425677 RepID=A0ABU0JJG7_9HYPH|nr:cyclic nucleotide-binding domain-containing protein [Labrys wisconsinensis]MDQ0473626.1 hypothetical protein [Labrys wisconsinensis]
MLGTLISAIRWNDLLGNCSYVIMAFSFLVTSMLWLRVLATVSMLIEIVYFLNTGDDLITAIGWDVAFIAINLWRIWALHRARSRVRALPDLRLLRAVFPGIDDGQIAEIVKAGAWYDLAPGALLAVQGTPIGALYLICEGRAEVRIDERLVAHLGPGELVGEVGFLTAAPATASVSCEGPTRVIAIDRTRLQDAAKADPTLASAVHRVIGEALARKLAGANRQPASGGPAP